MAEITTKDTLGRSITIKELDITDQFDLIEAAGALSENKAWFGLAALVFSVTSIDGQPMPKPTRKEDFRRNSATLKTEGVNAVAEHFKGIQGDTAEGAVEAAKN